MRCTRLAGNTGHKNDAKNRHLRTIAQLCLAISSQLGHVPTIGKKLIKQRYVLHMSPQYGELRPTNGWNPSGSLRHPCKFQRVSRLGSVTARHLVVGVSQTLRRWTEGATCVRQGGHHVGHWPTFLVGIWLTPCKTDKYLRGSYRDSSNSWGLEFVSKAFRTSSSLAVLAYLLVYMSHVCKRYFGVSLCWESLDGVQFVVTDVSYRITECDISYKKADMRAVAKGIVTSLMSMSVFSVFAR